MPYNGFVPSVELRKFQQEHGEDAYLMVNLLYAAFELNDLYDEQSDEGEFDELCDVVLEMFLDDAFDDYSIADVADGVAFIIGDSNYTVRGYVDAYQRHRDDRVEELLALLEKGTDGEDEDEDELSSDEEE